MFRLSGAELRRRYLEFFEEKGHARLPSAPLVPVGDPTVLLTNAGMVQFKPYFLGVAQPPVRRITTVQRCLRTGDIDRVGHSARHGTFFEMLGNFSFGDYFKREAIGWAWEFVTKRLGFAHESVWVSIYQDDDEAFAIWNTEVGIPAERIVRLGRADNFWEIGVGPCGPCSELYLDRGADFGCGSPDCKPGCDCERFLEFWNLVFIQFFQDADGNLTPLEKPGIDTGMGLERTAAILQDVRTVFDTDLLQPVIAAVGRLSGVAYGEAERSDVSIRIIADHARAVFFLAADGVVPGNEGREYVMRRLLRRAACHGRLLGIRRPFLAEVAQVLAEQYAGIYDEALGNVEYVLRLLTAEETHFYETLDAGMRLLQRTIERLAAEGGATIPGEDAFLLYDTYGFPLDLTVEMAEQSGFEVDRAGFDQAMEAQRQRARAARADSGGYLGETGTAYAGLVGELESRFIGYEALRAESQITALIADGRRVESAQAGEAVEVILDVTPFYAAGGGQIADTGVIAGSAGQVVVDEVERIGQRTIVHRGRVSEGRIQAGDQVTAVVDAARRTATAGHHTATHLLHKALHEVLGRHAKQAGSLVAPDRLRFDFSHFEPIAPDELDAIERDVNEKIRLNLPVTTTVTDYESAVGAGAMALFGEKYGDRVRLVTIGDYSKELCGGTHVRASGDLGFFKIVSEGGVAAGVRRIEALAGEAAVGYVKSLERQLDETARQLGAHGGDVVAAAERVRAELQAAQRESARLRDRLAQLESLALLDRTENIGPTSVLIAPVADYTGDLAVLGDQLKARLDEYVIVLGARQNGKANFVAMASDGAIARGLKAGDIVREAAAAAGGKGGGRPQMGKGGGPQAERLEEGLQRAKEAIMRQLSVSRTH